MARMRSLKPEFWSDLKMAQLSRDARLLYLALWNQADEWGRCHGDVRYVKGHCLPYDDDLGDDAIEGLLAELAAAARIVRYEVDGEPVLMLPKLEKHQRLEPAKTPSRLPPPPGMTDVEENPNRSEKNPESVSHTEWDEFPLITAPLADSGKSANQSEPIVAKHVAGSKEHVAGGKSSDASTAFDRFWDAYPRRTAKIAARKAWPNAARSADPETIIAGAQRMAADPNLPEERFIPHPATWLNRGQWDDPPYPPRDPPPGGPRTYSKPGERKGNYA